jgi:hypothetical protein
MNRHDTDAVSLVFGVIFAAFVGWWLLLRWVTVDEPGPGWFLAGALLVLGALGILSTVRSARSRKPVDVWEDDQP